MRIHRPPHANLPHGPSVTLYGRTDGHLLGPLDLVVMELEEGRAVYAPPVEPGLLRRAPVHDAEGAVVGTIEIYAWPPELPTRVDPVVRLMPPDDAPFDHVPEGTGPEPEVEAGDPVLLSDGGAGVPGELAGLLEPRPYPDPGHRTDAYEVTFPRHLSPEHHGTPVRLRGKALLGMLIATENGRGGECRALVYPAHLI